MDMESDHDEGPSGHVLDEIEEQHGGVPEGQDVSNIEPIRVPFVFSMTEFKFAQLNVGHSAESKINEYGTSLLVACTFCRERGFHCIGDLQERSITCSSCILNHVGYRV